MKELINEIQEFKVQLWSDLDKHTSFEYYQEAGNHYYDLVVINYKDEENYERSMTVPFPVLEKSTHKGARLLLLWLKNNWEKVTVCKRHEYQRLGHRKPIFKDSENNSKENV